MKKLNQSGAVAMISVVIFSIIITILVAAYARTIISQQREAINYDLSTRAYYAAESGVQDVIRSLSSDLNGDLANKGQQDCKGASGYLGNNPSGELGGDALAITCQLVGPNPQSIEGQTDDSESRLWQIKTDGDASQITVDWSAGSSGSAYSLPSGDDKLFLPTTTWSSSAYPPVVRIDFIKKVGLTYQQAVYFVKPSSSTAENPTLNFSQSSDSKVQIGHCENSSGYSCSITFSTAGLEPDMTQGSIYVVLHGIYGESHYKITPSDSAGKPVGVKNLVDIDVTARAGNVFRRVKQQVNLGGKDTYQTSWFNADALVVGDGICKLFTVGTTPSQYSTQCTGD